MIIFFQNMVHICVYMEDLVITINDSFKKYMDILDEILNSLENSGFHINVVKWKRVHNFTIYLEFVVKQTGIKTSDFESKGNYGD